VSLRGKKKKIRKETIQKKSLFEAEGEKVEKAFPCTILTTCEVYVSFSVLTLKLTYHDAYYNKLRKKILKTFFCLNENKTMQTEKHANN